MWPFASSNAILYLDRTKLEYFNAKALVATLELPKEVFANLEVVSPEKFRELLENFLKGNEAPRRKADEISSEQGASSVSPARAGFKNNLARKEVILFLSPDVVFQKDLRSEDPEEVKSFLSELPFDPNNVLSKVISSGGKKTIFAANKIPIDSIIAAVQSQEGRINEAVPLAAFNLTSIDAGSLKMILKNKSLLAQGNFLSEEVSHPEGQESKPVPRKFLSKKVIVEVAAIILLLISVATIFYFGIYKPSFSKTQKKTPKAALTVTTKPKTGTSSAEAKQANESTASAKQNLTIQILNGTGRAGDAGKVKETLVALGYQNIETGNNAEQNATDTLISFTSTVSGEIKKEIESELKKLFSSVKTQNEATSSPRFSISITTGQ